MPSELVSKLFSVSDFLTSYKISTSGEFEGLWRQPGGSKSIWEDEKKYEETLLN